MKEILLYALFITLSFLLTICSPLIIGNQLHEMDEEGSIYITICKNLLHLLGGVVAMIFKGIHDIISLLIESKLGFVDEEDVNGKPRTIFALLYFLIGYCLFTVIYYKISMLIWGSVFEEAIDVVLNNASSDLLDKNTIIALVIDNFDILKELVHEDHCIFKFIFQILITFAYIGGIYFGADSIGYIKYDGELSKFSILYSLNIVNIFIVFTVITIFMIICSITGTVDKIALILLFLNIFNIEISVGTAVVVATPVVVKKVVQMKPRGNRQNMHNMELNATEFRNRNRNR